MVLLARLAGRRGETAKVRGAWRALCAAPAAGALGGSAARSGAGRGRSLAKDFGASGQTRAARGTPEGQARECSKHLRLRERHAHRRRRPRSARVSLLFFSSPLLLSAFLPPSLSPSFPTPTPKCSPLLRSGTPLPELPSTRHAPSSELLTAPLAVLTLQRLLPPRAPSSHPCTSPSWGPRLILLSAPLSVPRSSPRSPAAPAGTRGARAFPPRAAVVRRSPGPGGNPTPQVEGKMGRLGPVQLGPMSTRRRVPSAFPRDRELPGHHCLDCPR